tara:strand:+ start:3899 stop:5794 length:1896 start_codon:yes stop_codon:yes gene_type:complete
VGRRLAKLADDFVSRMARTKADYEDTNYYHGTGAHIKEGFIPSESGNLGGGVYLTPNPDSASKRAVLSKYRNRDKGKNPNVLQTRIRNDLSFFDMNENPFMDLDINKLKEQGYDGVRRFDDDVLQEINVFDPSNIRSVNAMFDPAKKGSSDLLASTMPAALGIGALATGEDAEAGPLAAGGRRIIDARFSGPVGSGSVRKGVTPTLEGMETSIAPRNMDMGGDYSLYDFEGSPYLLTQSDRSAAGGEITSVHGTQINPVDLRGGRDFMFDPKSKGQVWASDPNVVKSMSKRAQELYLQYGENPLLLPYSMAPTGIDFATMPLDTMVNYARERMSKANINKLDKRIREVIPEWKGVSDPTANAVFRDVKGPARKKVADIIDKDFREVNGGMSISEGRAATTASDQYIVPEGNIKNIGRIDTSAALPSESGHPTYRGSLPGEGIGTLTNEINARPFMAQNGRELTGDSADIRSLSMNHGFGQGIIDEKLLRSIYGAAQPRLLAGIAAGTAGGLGIASAYTQAERDANQRDLQALQRVDEQGEQERLDAEYAKHPQLDQFAQQLNQITTPSKNIDPNVAMTVGGLSNPLLTAYGLMTSESPLAGFTEYLRRMGADRSTWGRLKDSANGALDILP